MDLRASLASNMESIEKKEGEEKQFCFFYASLSFVKL